MNGSTASIEVATWLIEKNPILIYAKNDAKSGKDYNLELIDYSEKCYKLIEENGYSCFLPKSQVNVKIEETESNESTSEEKDLRSHKEIVSDFLKENKIKGIRVNSKTLTLFKKLAENKLEEKLEIEAGLKMEYKLFFDEENQNKKIEFVEIKKVAI
jgi:hypothetical protein